MLQSWLTEQEIDDLVTFIRDGLYDENASPEHLCRFVPPEVPSGLPVLEFQACNAIASGGRLAPDR